MEDKRLDQLASSIVKLDRKTRIVTLKVADDEIVLPKQENMTAAKAQWTDTHWVIKQAIKIGANEESEKITQARNILIAGLKYHEHDGHDMPKRVTRNALIALGVEEEDQP